MAEPRPGAIRRTIVRREKPNTLRFLTFSCFRRLPLFGNDAIKDLFAQALADARAKHRFALIAWVVMPEHVHLLVTPRPAVGWRAGRQIFASCSTVRDILHDLKGSVSRDVLARWRALRAPVLARITDSQGQHRFWQQGGGFDHNTRTEGSLLHQIGYIHENPVRRGLVERAENWAWSSAQWYAGKREGQITIDFALQGKWSLPPEWFALGVDLRENSRMSAPGRSTQSPSATVARVRE